MGLTVEACFCQQMLLDGFSEDFIRFDCCGCLFCALHCSQKEWWLRLSNASCQMSVFVGLSNKAQEQIPALLLTLEVILVS